jgi:phosphoribosylformimino-5-aminoimidazole carboxamide ribotide isomerase
VEIIPVIDVKGGQVVRGIAGRRDEYRPIESWLCCTADPDAVAGTFAALGFRRVYIADLDAIEHKADVFFAGRQNDGWRGLDLLLDAGLSSTQQARELAQLCIAGRPLSGIVAGLESLPTPAVLEEIIRTVGPERLVFSLDMKAGRPLTSAPSWQNLSPRQIAVLALRLGVRRMIVLDLARVGVGEGVGTEPLCRELRCLEPELELIAGGGVRGYRDLESLARAGCSAALVASALHDGRLDAAACATTLSRQLGSHR